MALPLTLPFAAALIISCASGTPQHATVAPGGDPAITGTPPDFLLGAFDDDYGGHPEITATQWKQGARTVYLPVAWHAESQYVIARNADSNLTAPGAWTRIDWMRLDGMPPYEWAYCLSAYDAPTRDSAERTHVAARETPRTGCNGFPFSRLKRTRGVPAPNR